MQTGDLAQRIKEAVLPLIEAEGYTLWGLEMASRGKRRVVCFYLDKEGGLGLDDIGRMSKQMALTLEVDDVIPGSYILEVSSPGLERKFFAFDQIVEYVGRTVKVEIAQPRDGRKKYTGSLSRAENGELDIDDAGETHTFVWDEIRKARLVHTFEKPGKKKHQA